MEAFRESATKLAAQIDRMVSDQDQFYRHLIEVKGESRFEEIVTGKADTRALRDMVAAVKDMASTLLMLDGGGTQAGGVILLPEVGETDEQYSLDGAGQAETVPYEKGI